MRVLVCGSRNWFDRQTIKTELDKLKLASDSTIIEGGAHGADLIAADYARYRHYALEEYNADWSKYGKAAGPIRNQQMLDTGIDLVVAFQIGESRGTQDMINRAKAKGVKVIVIKGKI